jgi:ribonuclease HII
MLGDLDQQLWRQRRLVAGVDEAGWGAWAGPVYAACVVLYPQRPIPGLNDSKQLTAARREALYPLIDEQALALGIGVAGARYFNQHGASAAWAHAMRHAIQRCVAQLTPAERARVVLLIDGVRPVTHGLAIPRTILGPRLDGQAWTVAAASIVAKVTRDRRMQELDQRYPHYGFAAHKGYGVHAHRDALLKYGALPLQHRQQYISRTIGRIFSHDVETVARGRSQE